MTPNSLRGAVILGTTAALAVLTAAPAAAHHEAIFGTQSALVLSSSRYLTAQVFTRQTGTEPSDRVRETTTVLSAGYAPINRPLSVSVVMPFSVLQSNGPDRTRSGLENALLGARYRFDLFGLTEALSLSDSYVIAAGGVELPTGTLDHPFGHGAMAGVAAGLFGVEKGRFSASAYAFFRRPGEYDDGREGGNRFVGGGAGWTLRDDPVRVVSVNLGLSHETTFLETRNRAAVAESGGSGIFLHPTVLVGVSERLMFFGQTTLPLTQTWQDPANRERFRLGAGAIVMLGY